MMGLALVMGVIGLVALNFSGSRAFDIEYYKLWIGCGVYTTC
jgi:hypothetical protein